MHPSGPLPPSAADIRPADNDNLINQPNAVITGTLSVAGATTFGTVTCNGGIVCGANSGLRLSEVSMATAETDMSTTFGTYLTIDSTAAAGLAFLFVFVITVISRLELWVWLASLAGVPIP